MYLFYKLRYNNKTYKVDDIAWDMRPTDTFEKGGEKISYKQYYKDVSNLRLCNFYYLYDILWIL